MHIFFIDESGNLGKREKFFVITVIEFNSSADRKKWKKIAYTVKKSKGMDEIKANNMTYELKKEVMKEIVQRDIRYKVWLGVIDTDHEKYVQTYIQKNNSKELAYNYTLGKLFEEKIGKQITEKEISIYSDQRSTRTGSTYFCAGYLQMLLLNNPEIIVQTTQFTYKNSKDSYGIQLADLIANIAFTNFEYGKSKSLFETYIQPNLYEICTYPDC